MLVHCLTDSSTALESTLLLSFQGVLKFHYDAPLCDLFLFIILGTWWALSVMKLRCFSFQKASMISLVQFSSVQSLSRVWLFETPWTTARQASLSITNSQSLPKLMSVELVMPSNHLILCRPLLLPPSIFPSIRVFSNESALHIRWPNIRVSASISVLPMNTQEWSL